MRSDRLAALWEVRSATAASAYSLWSRVYASEFLTWYNSRRPSWHRPRIRGKEYSIGKVSRKSETLRMTLTSKLQVSLPARARDRYGLRAGDQLEVELGEGEMRMRPIRRRRLTELGGALRVVAPFSTHDDVRTEAADALAEHYDARAAAASSQR